MKEKKRIKGTEIKKNGKREKEREGETINNSMTKDKILDVNDEFPYQIGSIFHNSFNQSEM